VDRQYIGEEVGRKGKGEGKKEAGHIGMSAVKTAVANSAPKENVSIFPETLASSRLSFDFVCDFSSIGFKGFILPVCSGQKLPVGLQMGWMKHCKV
jgi:hypothetical protein